MRGTQNTRTKYIVLLVSFLSITWAKSTLPDDFMGYEEEDVPEMKHRQIRDTPPNRGALGTLSTRPFLDKATLTTEFDDFKWGTSSAWSAYDNSFKDPFWKRQWYQQDIRVSAGPVMDHNIVPVQRMGFNGKGISIGILGESMGRDLYDMQDRINDIVYKLDALTDDEPKNLPTIANMATMVAGVIAMNANNSQCGAGIAYNAQITGIVVMELEKYDTDNIHRGMMHNLGNLHIYVDAIKQTHDGKSMEYNEQIKNDLTTIATKGRKNKGGIYVVGAGNGRKDYDNCGADYIVNSIHTFVIGSASYKGRRAIYSESCSGIIAAAYSSSDIQQFDQTSGDFGLVTVDGTKRCVDNFGGTAGSAAIASGIFALTLQANPNLSWRDLMHVVAMTSERAPLHKSDSFKINGAGFLVSNEFGFGLLNAENMVLAAQQWKLVSKMLTCKIIFTEFGDIQKGGISISPLDVKSCPTIDNANTKVNYIEQVELVTTISHFKRGGISITLISPKATQSILLEKRSNDLSGNKINKWALRSLNFWGEQPIGEWQFVVDAEVPDSDTSYVGCADMIIKLSQNFLQARKLGKYGNRIKSAELLIHGTSDKPKHYSETPSHRRINYSFAPGPS